MPYQVEWLDKPYIVFIKLSGKLNEDDMRSFMEELVALAAEVPDVAVHSLVDASEIEHLPPINSVLADIRRMLKAFPNRSMSTMFGVSKLVRFMVEMLVKLTTLRIRIFDTHEEAEAFVREMVAAELAGEGDDPE